jgi:diguanylate cyclase (GGDEF)-like protein
MASETKQRVLLVPSDDQRSSLRNALSATQWDIVEANTLEHAAFVQEAQPCDVIVLDGTRAGPAWSEGVIRLARLATSPIVFIANEVIALLLEMLPHGARWLPANIVTEHPELFLAHLQQAISLGNERLLARQTVLELRNCQARVDRLLSLLWETVPGEGPTRWFSQRHMLERLDEEVARTRRNGGPLAVILGELRAESGDRLAPEQLGKLATWMTQVLSDNKRRSDVAGQYGLGGFMLVLPQASTHEAEGACRRLGRLLRHPGHDDLPAVHVCFGISHVPDDPPSVQVLLRHAEERLDQEVASGSEAVPLGT